MKQDVMLLPLLGIIAWCMMSGCFKADRPNIVYVDDNFDAAVDGWAYDHFQSIQDAINGVDTPGCIMIKKGTYKESLLFDRPGTYDVIGEDAWNTIISGEGLDGSLIVVGSMVSINLSGCTIQGNASDKKSTCYDAGLRLESENNTIGKNRFIGHCCGIYMEEATQTRITDNWFQDNYYGILCFTGSNANEIQGNVFMENQIGCKLKGSSENWVHANLFSLNEGGIYLCCLSTGNLFEGNVFKKQTEFHAQDWCINTWNGTTKGNFWDDFYRDNQQAFDENNDGIVDNVYTIDRGYEPDEFPNNDYLPLRDEPIIQNWFIEDS